MKLSTYIMCGAVAVGFVISGLACISSVRGEHTVQRPLSLDGPTVDKQLPANFSVVKLNEKQIDTEYHLSGFSGIKVEKSDSVSTPTLRASEPWMEILTVALNNDTLSITVNPQAMIDTTNVQQLRRVWLYSDKIWPVSVVIPSDMTVDEITSATSSVQLQYFDTDRIDINTNSRIVIYRCNIDTLHCISKLDELKVDYSTVNLAQIAGSINELNLNTCNGTGKVNSISFIQ